MKRELTKVILSVAVSLISLASARFQPVDKMHCPVEGKRGGCWIEWSADGQRVAIWGGNLDSVDIWEVNTNKPSLQIGTHIVAAVWYPLPEKGHLIATLSNFPPVITIWDTETGDAVQSYSFKEELEDDIESGRLGYFPDFTDIAWSPSGHIALVGIASGEWVGIWHIDTNEFQTLVRDTGQNQPSMAVSWSPDQQYLALGGTEIQLYDTDTLQLSKTLGTNDLYYTNAYATQQSLAWSPDGRFLAIDGVNAIEPTEIVVRVYEISTGELFTLESHSSPINAIAWSPDGEFIASAGGADFLGTPPDNTIRIWDMENHKLFREIPFEESITSITWNPDGNQLATVDLTGTVYIIEME